MQISYPLLLDGGLSNELESLGCDLNHKLWSARMLHKDVEKLVEAHSNYIKAGAKCIITSSYQASIPGMVSLGFTKQKAEELILRSVLAAEEAVRQCQATDILIAASIGPYGAYLGDGSEYHGNYNVTDDVIKQFHWERFQILEKSKAHVYACETIPSLQEAKVLHELLKQTTKQAWVSCSCKNDKQLNDGTPIKEIAKLFADHPNVFAIGVNCTKPEYISGLIKELKSFPHNKKIIVYPNSGETYDPRTKSWNGEIACTMLTKEWLALGADIIGGCCRVGPGEIREIASSL